MLLLLIEAAFLNGRDLWLIEKLERVLDLLHICTAAKWPTHAQTHPFRKNSFADYILKWGKRETVLEIV